MVFLLAVVLAAATPASANPQPMLKRLDAVTLNQGDGPLVVSVRSNTVSLRDSANSLDRFSARILPVDATTAAWQPCTAAAGAFCEYTPGGNGVRTLRFERVDAAGELQIRYTYPDAPNSNIIRIVITPQSPTKTLQAIGRAFGAAPAAAAPGAAPAAALLVDLSVVAPPVDPNEVVRVSCASAPLYTDTKRTPLRAGARLLAAKNGAMLTVERNLVGNLRAIDFGVRVYLDAKCVKPA